MFPKGEFPLYNEYLSMVSNAAVLVTSRPTIFDVLRMLHSVNSCVKDHCKVFLKKENLFCQEIIPFLVSFLTWGRFWYQRFTVKYYAWNNLVHLLGKKIISFFNMHFSAETWPRCLYLNLKLSWKPRWLFCSVMGRYNRRKNSTRRIWVYMMLIAT